LVNTGSNKTLSSSVHQNLTISTPKADMQLFTTCHACYQEIHIPVAEADSQHIMMLYSYWPQCY